MKKDIIKTVTICDKCMQEADYAQGCMKCGTHICYECSKHFGKHYQHGVYILGSGDGFYCTECDAELSLDESDDLHNAYVRIQRLRSEAEEWNLEFKAKVAQAEHNVMELQRKEVGCD